METALSLARELERLRGRQATPGLRRPAVAILTCVDERIAPELLFGCGAGTLYTVRLAGHVVTPEVVASLEIALKPGCPLVFVLGHTDCSAVRLEREHRGSPFVLLQHIRWTARSLPWRASLEDAIEANVRHAIGELRERLRVRVGGGIYGVGTGRVQLLEPADRGAELKGDRV